MRRVLPTASAAELIDSILLLVTEVVTNAVVHARSAVRVHVLVEDSRIRIDVHDQATTQPPIRRPASEDSLGGRGLLLLEGLADRWGYEPSPDGKVVWFELATPPSGRTVD